MVRWASLHFLFRTLGIGMIDVSELSAYEEKHHSEKELGCSQNIRVGTK